MRGRASLVSSWPLWRASAGASGRLMSPHRWLRIAARRSWAKAARAVCRQDACQALAWAWPGLGLVPAQQVLPGLERLLTRRTPYWRSSPRARSPGVLRRHVRGRVPRAEGEDQVPAVLGLEDRVGVPEPAGLLVSLGPARRPLHLSHRRPRPGHQAQEDTPPQDVPGQVLLRDPVLTLPALQSITGTPFTAAQAPERGGRPGRRRSVLSSSPSSDPIPRVERRPLSTAG